MTSRPPPRKRRSVHAQGKRVTLEDVAARAKVSAITVSRALRDPKKVSEEVRTRIHRAIDALGYIENRVASGLASGSSRIVPVIVPTLAHPVYVPFLQGVHAELDELGYQVILATTEYRQEVEAQLVQSLLGWFPAGLLVAGVDHLPETRKRLRQAVEVGLHVVEFMDLTSNPIDINVGLSHRAAGEAVANYLADEGYRHIAYAGTMMARDHRGERRWCGFRDALRARGLPADYELRVDESFSIALGGHLLTRLLEAHPRIDAIFFANDDLAAGALFEARRRGIAVPRRLAIVGFNDLEIAAASDPPITSVAVDQRAMGRTAARLLSARFEGADRARTIVDTGFRIVERESSSMLKVREAKGKTHP